MIFKIRRQFALTVALVIGCLSLSPYGLAQEGASDAKASLLISATYVEDGRVIVLLNSREFWNSHGYLTDTYSEEEQKEVNRIQNKVELSTLSESTFEARNEEASLASIRRELKKAGAPVNRQFQKWVNQEFIAAE